MLSSFNFEFHVVAVSHHLTVVSANRRAAVALARLTLVSMPVGLFRLLPHRRLPLSPLTATARLRLPAACQFFTLCQPCVGYGGY